MGDITMATPTAQRRFPNGTPIHLRYPKFSSKETGRLSNMEYNIIDMKRILDTDRMDVIAPTVGMSLEAALRFWGRMKTSGLVTGGPSDFRLTRAALEAWREADRWLVDPSSRPAGDELRMWRLGKLWEQAEHIYDRERAKEIIVDMGDDVELAEELVAA